MNPLLSVIIPIYNIEQYISKCLDSVLSQTYTNLEIILVDDGSTDNSGKICDTYEKKDSRIKIIHQKNSGLSSARNKGIDISTGQYIGFVDGDDYIDKDMFEILLKTIIENNADISVCHCDIIYPTYTFYPKQSGGICNIEEALYKCADSYGFYAWNKLYKKDIWNKIYFPPNMLFEDIATLYKVFDRTKKIIFLDTIKYHYNKQNQSITGAKFHIKKLDYFKATKELLDYCKNKHYYKAERLILEGRIWHIASFLRQIIEANFNDKKTITILIKELRKNIFLHLKSKHKLLNKLFAACAIINFNFAKLIYNLIGKR